MEKINRNIGWFLFAMLLIVHFIPKGDIKDYINWALLVIMIPLLIIKGIKENNRKANIRILTDITIISLMFLIWYLSKQ
jgi:exosortase/archaeosortase